MTALAIHRRVWSETLWSKPLESSCPVTRPYERAGRVIFPLSYFLYMIAGLLAFLYGAPALSLVFGTMPMPGAPQALFDDPFTDAFGIWQILLALLAFVGYGFNRLWLVEYVFMYLLLAQASIYAGSILFLAGEGDNTRAYVWMISTIALLGLVFRAYIFSKELQRRDLGPTLLSWLNFFRRLMRREEI